MFGGFTLKNAGVLSAYCVYLTYDKSLGEVKLEVSEPEKSY